jgi:D-glycero-D-manno-heptose 1,7-bisphosphate phosphatase
VALLPGVAGALAALGAAGYALVVATNQAGVARRYDDEAAVAPVHRRLHALPAAGATPLFVTTGRAAGRRPPAGTAAFPSLAAAADAVLQGPREPGPPRP